MAWVNFTSFVYNSATNPTDFLVGYVGQYEQRYPIFALKNGLSAGLFPVDELLVKCDATVEGNLTVYKNLSVLGDISAFETIVSISSALSVVNTGTGPAVYVKQTGSEPIAVFNDDTFNHLRLDDGLRTSFYNSTATASYALAEGNNTLASGTDSHAEGNSTIASGPRSHAEGMATKALSANSHAEGHLTQASGAASHSEGQNTTASGDASHAEGGATLASGNTAHAEGLFTRAFGESSHAAGTYIAAAHDRTWAWKGSTATNIVSTTRTDQFMVSAANGLFLQNAVGINTDNNTNALTVAGVVSAVASNHYLRGSVAEGDFNVLASGINSHAEGSGTTASQPYAHAEGEGSTAGARAAHAEGVSNNATGFASHAEGTNTTASLTASHAEGRNTISSNIASHAEGEDSDASGRAAHAEGYDTTASNQGSHAEGYTTEASGIAAHSQGFNTKASGDYSSSQGQYTTAVGNTSHAGGNKVTAAHDRTWAWKGSTDTNTISTTRADQFLVSAAGGAYFTDTVGINTDSRANALTVKGSISASNDLNVGGNTTIAGNLSVFGEFTALDTIVSVTSALSVINAGTGPAVYVKQTGVNPVVEFYDDIYNTLRIDDNFKTSFYNSTANAQYSLAEGYLTLASGVNSHSEGDRAVAQGQGSHAEGYSTYAQGQYSHTQNYGTSAIGNYSHAEGDNTTSSGIASHSEGSFTRAVGNYSHAAGISATAAFDRSWVWKGSTDTNSVSTTRADQFMVSAAGGVFVPGNVGIGTDYNNNALTVFGSISTLNGPVFIGDDRSDAYGLYANSGIPSHNVIIGSSNAYGSSFTNRSGNFIVGSKNIIGSPVPINSMPSATRLYLTYGSLSTLPAAQLQPGLLIPFAAGETGSTYSGTFTVAGTGRLVSPPTDYIDSVQSLPVGPPVTNIFLNPNVQYISILGNFNNVGNAINTVAVGYGNVARGLNSGSFGNSVKVLSNNSIGCGANQYLSGDNCFAYGYANVVTGDNSTSIGRFAWANFNNSMVIKADGTSNFSYNLGAIPLNTRTGQMSLCAQGGYYFYGTGVGIGTDNNSNALTVNGVVSGNNALVITGNTNLSGSLSVGTNLSVNGNTTLGDANSDTTTIRGNVKIADSSATALQFGTSDGTYDTNLYRTAADTLKTDDSLIVDTNLTVNGNTTLGSDANDTVTIKAGPVILESATSIADALQFGSGANLANLYRVSNDQLKTDDNFEVGTNLLVDGNSTLGDANTDTTTVRGSLKLLDSTQTTAIDFGDGTSYDTNLYRSTSNTLKTDDNFVVGTLGAGSTNDVVTHSTGTLQTRSINSRVWDTNATFLSGQSLTNNTLPKASGSGNNTLINSNITDSGTSINLGSATTINGTLSTNNNIVFGTQTALLSATTLNGTVTAATGTLSNFFLKVTVGGQEFGIPLYTLS